MVAELRHENSASPFDQELRTVAAAPRDSDINQLYNPWKDTIGGWRLGMEAQKGAHTFIVYLDRLDI